MMLNKSNYIEKLLLNVPDFRKIYTDHIRTHSGRLDDVLFAELADYTLQAYASERIDKVEDVFQFANLIAESDNDALQEWLSNHFLEVLQHSPAIDDVKPLMNEACLGLLAALADADDEIEDDDAAEMETEDDESAQHWEEEDGYDETDDDEDSDEDEDDLDDDESQAEDDDTAVPVHFWTAEQLAESGFPAEFLFSLSMKLDEVIMVGKTPYGQRMMYPASGGAVEGARIRGEVLSYGGGWWIERSDGVREIDTRILLKTWDGEHIDMRFTGILRIAATVLGQINAGASVAPDAYYCRIAARFETSSEAYGWLNSVVAIGIGTLAADALRFEVFGVL